MIVENMGLAKIEFAGRGLRDDELRAWSCEMSKVVDGKYANRHDAKSPFSAVDYLKSMRVIWAREGSSCLVRSAVSCLDWQDKDLTASLVDFSVSSYVDHHHSYD